MIAAAKTCERRRWLAHGLLASAVLVCVTLFVYPPVRAGFYPACPIYMYLHIECPGCGATRALAALLRGRVAEAWRLNALFVILLPIGVGGAGECYRRAVRVAEFTWPTVPPNVTYAILLGMTLFTVARNLGL